MCAYIWNRRRHLSSALEALPNELLLEIAHHVAEDRPALLLPLSQASRRLRAILRPALHSRERASGPRGLIRLKVLCQDAKLAGMIRCLKLDGPAQHDWCLLVSHLLEDAFPKFTNLSSLTLRIDDPVSPRLSRAIAALPRLDSLAIKVRGDDIGHCLSLVSGLREIHIDLHQSKSPSQAATYSPQLWPNIARLLNSSRETLQSVLFHPDTDLSSFVEFVSKTADPPTPAPSPSPPSSCYEDEVPPAPSLRYVVDHAPHLKGIDVYIVVVPRDCPVLFRMAGLPLSSIKIDSCGSFSLSELVFVSNNFPELRALHLGQVSNCSTQGQSVLSAYVEALKKMTNLTSFRVPIPLEHIPLAPSSISDNISSPSSPRATPRGSVDADPIETRITPALSRATLDVAKACETLTHAMWWTPAAVNDWFEDGSIVWEREIKRTSGEVTLEESSGPIQLLL